MLEKALGNCAVEKLSDVLLLETDFNVLHEINFKSRSMPSLETSLAIPDKIIGNRRSLAAAHLALSKKLIAYASNINKRLTATICANATNHCNRVTHPCASLCSQCFGIDACCMLALFRTIQNIKMNLRTIFSVSTSCCISNSLPFQGAVQGNRVALELWLIILIFLIRCLHRQKVDTAVTLPVSKMSQCFSALLHADDTDLHVFNDGCINAKEVLTKVQCLLHAWHDALKCAGGDLKLSKCY